MQPGTALAPIKGLRNLMTTDPFFMLQNRLNRLFDIPLAPFVEETLPLTTWTPACDIYETAKEIVVKAELPGLKKEDVLVSIENNMLMIQMASANSPKRSSERTSIVSSATTASFCEHSHCRLSSTPPRS